MRKFKMMFPFFAIMLLSVVCKKENMSNPDYTDLKSLPKDTGGIQRAEPYSNSLEYGYYVYTPSGYEKNTAVYPLMVFLHGAGERGNSMNDSSALKKVLVNGPPKLIEQKKWVPAYPMIVVSPQCHEMSWDGKKLQSFFKYLISTYRVNTRRIYLTGLSMGGFGTFKYLETYSDSGYVAAAVAICGGGNPNNASRLLNIPLWIFHGEKDNIVLPSRSIEMFNAINALNPSIKPKLILYPGVEHDSWSRTYDATGMGTENPDYDPFNISIYDWMFRYSK